MKRSHLISAAVMILSSLMCVGLSYFAPHQKQLGAFYPTGAGTYLLQSSISSSQTSITLTSFTEPQSNIPYTMTYLGSSIEYGTIAPSTGRSEFISFTGITQNTNGTATLTGVTRGLARSPGAAGCVASTTLANAYPGQTQFILGDSPCFYSQYAVKQNDETISGLWHFDQNPTGLNPGAVANASVSVSGISQLATGLQTASSTAIGSTLAALVIPASVATDTPNSATRTSRVLVSDLTGYIKQGWLNLTQSFTFSGGLTSSATSTFACSNVNSNGCLFNTVSYKWPSSRGAANSVLTEDGSGNLSFAAVTPTRYTYSTTTPNLTKSNGYATTTAFFTVPAGTVTASSTIDVYGDWSCAQANSTQTTCHIYLSDSLGNLYADMPISFAENNNQTISCDFHTQITFNNSTSAEVSITQTSGGSQPSSAVQSNYCPTNLVKSLALNYANAQTLGIVVRGNDGNATATLNYLTISVTR